MAEGDHRIRPERQGKRARVMARELGREATLAELAERMKMSEDEIRDIMKLTMDAMKVSGQAAEMAQKEIDEQE